MVDKSGPLHFLRRPARGSLGYDVDSAAIVHAQHRCAWPELKIAGGASNLVRRFFGDLVEPVAANTA